MGSRPWKQQLIDTLEMHFSGLPLRVERPNGEVVSGIFIGSGTKNRQPHIIVNNAPPECPSPGAEKQSGGKLTRAEVEAAWAAHGRDWFSYEQWIPLGRGLMIEGQPAADYQREASHA